MSDPLQSFSPSPLTFGTEGQAIVPDDGTDIDPVPKAVEVTDANGGTNVLQILPVNNANGAWLTYTDVPVGFKPSFRVRRVGTATTCTVVSVDG